MALKPSTKIGEIIDSADRDVLVYEFAERISKILAARPDGGTRHVKAGTIYEILPSLPKTVTVRQVEDLCKKMVSSSRADKKIDPEELARALQGVDLRKTTAQDAMDNPAIGEAWKQSITNALMSNRGKNYTPAKEPAPSKSSDDLEDPMLFARLTNKKAEENRYTRGSIYIPEQQKRSNAIGHDIHSIYGDTSPRMTSRPMRVVSPKKVSANPLSQDYNERFADLLRKRHEALLNHDMRTVEKIDTAVLVEFGLVRKVSDVNAPKREGNTSRGVDHVVVKDAGNPKKNKKGKPARKMSKRSMAILMALIMMFLIVACGRSCDFGTALGDDTYITDTDSSNSHKNPVGSTAETPAVSMEALEDIKLEYKEDGRTLTDACVMKLARAAVNEMHEIYDLAGVSAPEVVTPELIAALNFYENSHKATDTDGPYRGIGQIGLGATTDGVKHCNKRLDKALENMAAMSDKDRKEAENVLSDNYYYNMIYNKDSGDVWEKLSTDPKLSTAMSGIIFGVINDNYYSSLKENPSFVVSSYNIGADTVISAINRGIFVPSSDYKTFTIDYTKIAAMEKEEREYLLAGVNYMIKLLGAAAEIKGMNSAYVDVLEQHRVNVGDKLGLQQFNYLPKGVSVEGLDHSMGN